MAARRYRLPVRVAVLTSEEVAVLTSEEEADGSTSLLTTCTSNCADL